MDDIGAIYEKYAQTVYKYLLSCTRNPSLAEELTQETFYRAVKSINRYDGSCKVSVWLCQIAKHCWYKYIAKAKKESPAEELTECPSAVDVENDVLARQNRNELLKAVHYLPEKEREVIYLRLFGGLSFRDIGDIMGHTENWARVTFHRTKQKLREDVKNNEK